MAEKDIEAYVRENLKKGISSEKIKERLRAYGHDPAIVDKILADARERFMYTLR